MDRQKLIRAGALSLLLAAGTGCAVAEDVVWYDGSRAVTYSVQKKVDPVVEVALQMFASDTVSPSKTVTCSPGCPSERNATSMRARFVTTCDPVPLAPITNTLT